LLNLVLAKAREEPIDQAALDRRLASAVTEVVKQQIECGLDVVNDGEFSKPNFTDYVLERIAGCEKDRARACTGSA
jgi:5-methyltetrahydropteroyltriglutamate--homocysteine methyltransferase